jgi:hypothetical protein
MISYLVHTRLDMYIYGPFKNFKTKDTIGEMSRFIHEGGKLIINH